MIRGVLTLSIFLVLGTANAELVGDADNGVQTDLNIQSSVHNGDSPIQEAIRTKKQYANSPYNKKMGNSIRNLVQKWQIHAVDGTARGIDKATLKRSFRPRNPFVKVKTSGEVQIYITTQDINDQVLGALKQLGLEIELYNTKLKKIQGWIDIDLLDALSELQGVIRITAPKYGQTNSGSQITEGDAILKSDELRSLGFSGQGIKVGIISDGANDWQTAQALGDLPEGGITTYGTCTKRLTPDKSNCESLQTCNEGTAMAEIIHDLAPDAELAVGYGLTTLEFIQRIDDLINDFGADIIVDDITFYGEPYFEDGDVADAVAAAANSVLFVSPAGNSAYGHYETEYSPLNGDTVHDFGVAEGGASDIDQGIIVPSEDYIWVIMQWNDPFLSSSNDYDLFLYGEDPDPIASSNEVQSGEGSYPIEGFCYYNSTTEDQLTWLYVNKYSGSSRILEIFTFRALVTQYNHLSGSIIGHSTVNNNVTVGSIQADDDGHDTIAYYSSRGPSRIDFPSLEYRAKPDVVGIDGVSVTGTGGFFNPFFGTSASASHVAGIAAQLMSVSPTVTIENVRNALADGASDLGLVGFDYDYGYGLANALESYEMLEGVIPGDVNGDGSVDLADAIIALQILSNFASGTVVKKADVDEDNKIGISEAIYILGDVSN